MEHTLGTRRSVSSFQKAPARWKIAYTTGGGKCPSDADRERGSWGRKKKEGEGVHVVEQNPAVLKDKRRACGGGSVGGKKEGLRPRKGRGVQARKSHPEVSFPGGPRRIGWEGGGGYQGSNGGTN